MEFLECSLIAIVTISQIVLMTKLLRSPENLHHGIMLRELLFMLVE